MNMTSSAGRLTLSYLCKYRNSLCCSAINYTRRTQMRTYRRWHRPVFQELYRRRIKQGPEPDRHRSEWSNWNYDSELYAFGKRLGEDFKEGTLSIVFTHRSYLEKEQKKREELEMITSGDSSDSGTSIEIKDNTDLVLKGERLCSAYIPSYLRHALPALPEEGVRAIADHLTDEKLTSYIGSNLGIKDLILCSESAPSPSTLSKTLMAVIGGLAQDQGDARAHLFIQDFIITQLIGKDLMELWPIVNPMGVLQNILTTQGNSTTESRLLYETGSSTILAVYMVGVYSNEELIGKGYGETVTIAEEMAARDALRRLFALTESRPALPYGTKGHSLKIDLTKVNSSLQDYTHPNQLQ